MTYQEYDVRIKIGLDNGSITEVADIINTVLDNQGIKVRDLQISGNDENLSQRNIIRCKKCGIEIHIDANLQKSYVRKPNGDHYCENCMNKVKE